MKVLKLYPQRSAANSLDFLDHAIEELPFPIQRVQTDRGMEFFRTARRCPDTFASSSF
jgi:hypothetical protein